MLDRLGRKPPPERIDPRSEPPGIVAHHLAKYAFASEEVGRGRILDVGCGLGYGTATLGDTHRLVMGVDVDPEAVQVATANYSNSSVAFACMDAERLAIKDGSMDSVVCLEAIEHFNQPRNHLREAVRILKPTGTYIVSTPAAGTGGSPELNPHHVHEFDRETLEGLLREFFLEVTIKGQTRHRQRVHGLVVRLDVLGIRRLRAIQPVLRKLASALGGRATADAIPADFQIGEGIASPSELVAIGRGIRSLTYEL